jgi:hypothetical protein
MRAMTTTAFDPDRGQLRLRATLVGAMLLLSACAGSPAPDPSLTPAQNQMREATLNWRRTVATGAVIGGVAATGTALAAGADGGTAVMIGLAGVVLGGLLASVVADRNFAFAKREATAGERIANADAVASDLERRVRLANQVVAQNRATLAQLDRQYRAGQITAAQYNAQVAPMRDDLKVIEAAAAQGQAAREEINRTQDLPQLRRAENRIGPAQRRLEASARDLEELLQRVPAV